MNLRVQRIFVASRDDHVISCNLVICFGYGYNIFNLGAIFASFTHSDSICFPNNVDK